MEDKSLDMIVASVVPELLSEIVVGVAFGVFARRMVMMGSRGTVSEGLVIVQCNGLRTGNDVLLEDRLGSSMQTGEVGFRESVI